MYETKLHAHAIVIFITNCDKTGCMAQPNKLHGTRGHRKTSPFTS